MQNDPNAPRYSRQVLFPPIGEAGQRRLLESTVVLVGCGALGASLGEQMARAGVGRLRLIDRDVVEESNLGRQALYTAQDAADHLPKAAALAGHLEEFNPDITVEPRVSDLNASTIRDLLDGADLVLDGCDNFDTRYLLNDWCVSSGRPWVYGACVASRGLTAVIVPGQTPCLRCLFPEPPPAGAAETCDTSGIIAPAATVVAALQAAEAIKILTGNLEAVRPTLFSIELWPFRIFEFGGKDPSPRADCTCCGKREFVWLDTTDRARVLTYCGRDAVQVVPASRGRAFDLDAVERRLAPSFAVRRNAYVLKVEVPDHTLTVFDDGRALISGTGDADRARALYDQYVGS
ncbi:MAG: thiamine biosynthesis protein ThiF [Planctomycetes bacterium]|nr:thiamine biosynthesis protein ThiF [Planctomycetota bacterium]